MAQVIEHFRGKCKALSSYSNTSNNNKKKVKIQVLGQVLVAHACNPSYSGGRDQEDRGSKPTLGK
jgi:hypothetical protein